MELGADVLVSENARAQNPVRQERRLGAFGQRTVPVPVPVPVSRVRS